ncbi:MAG TPA: glycosyltransferase family 4 protein [Chloroflexota bacterium]|nr:glycosyltransferase family 4 protein [Chloroflexota bacterium]
MRILMLSQFYPPIIGGEEQHVRNLSVALARRGHEVAVATLHHDDLPSFASTDGVRVYRLNGTMQRAAWLYGDSERRHAPPLPDPEAVAGLRRVVDAERPEVVHAHNWFVHSFVPLKRQSRAKLVLTLHDYSLCCATKRMMFRESACSGPALRRCVPCAIRHYGTLKGAATLAARWASTVTVRAAVDMFVPVSHAVAVGSGLTRDRLPFRVIPNFLPDEDDRDDGCFESYLSRLPASEFVLFVGDLSRQKGIDTLLAAFTGLPVRVPLVLIGRRLPDTPRVVPDGAHIFSNWPHGAIMAAWRRSMLGVVPSVWPDPCPTVALEAMASARPVIASAVGGLVDQVIDRETGLLVPPGDVDALRSAMLRLIADRGWRSALGESAQRHAERFRAATIVPSIARLYEELTCATEDGRHAA